MKTWYIALIPVILSILVACDKKKDTNLITGDTSVKAFNAEKTYKTAIFSSEEQCNQAKAKDPLVNCYKVIKFYKDGKVSLLLTDIMNTGSYQIREKDIQVSFSSVDGALMNVKTSFTLSDDEKSIRNNADGVIWNLSETL